MSECNIYKLKFLRASEHGLRLIHQAREEKRWLWNTVDDDTPLLEASKFIQLNENSFQEDSSYADGCSPKTWRSLLEGKRINASAFKAFCQALDLNWGDVVDTTSNIQLQQRAQRDSFRENFWVGRKSLIAELSAKLREDCRILVLTGITGIGKTALASKLAYVLPTEGFKRINLNLEDNEKTGFFSVVIDWLSQCSQKVTADNFKEPERLLNRLLQELINNSYLVQINSLEIVLVGDNQTGWNNFNDKRWVKFFAQLLAAPNCKSRLIITSQDLPTQFQEIGFVERRHCEPLTGLNKPEWLELFLKTGIEVELLSLNRLYLERIGTAYEGHPLALLVIAGEILSDPFSGDVVAWWRKYHREIEEIEKVRQQEEVESENDRLRLDRFTPKLQELLKKKVDNSLARLAKDFPVAYTLLCHGAVFRRPVPEQKWFTQLKEWGINEYKYEYLLINSIDVLYDRYLVEKVEEEFTDAQDVVRQHNLIRTVALRHLKKLRTRRKPS